MNTVYIVFKNGEVTTIKSKLALTIATGFIMDWFRIEDFKTIPALQGENRVFFMIEKGLDIKWFIESR